MSARSRRVLFVLANGGRGGMQSQVRLMATSLVRHGCEVVVGVGPGDFEPLDGVEVARLPHFSSKRPLSFLFAVRRLVRTCKPDVVHGHGLRLAPVVRWSGSTPTTRFVSCHGIDPQRAASTLRIVRHLKVSIISCGEGPRELLERFGVSSRVVNNAFRLSITRRNADEARHEFSLDATAPIIVFPARFSEQKNHRELLSALRAVRVQLGESAPEVLCFGDGPLFDTVRADAEVENSRPLVRCIAFYPDASNWMSAADFFVLPSRWEGQPQVVLEALSAGLSVLTSTETGIEDLVFDTKNGRRVKGAAGLADVMVQWIEQPDTKPRDEQLNARILARHDLEVVTADYIDLYGFEEPAS